MAMAVHLPFVHLALDGAHSSEAGSAQEVEYQEAVTGDAGEGLSDVLVHGAVAAAVQDTQRTHDVLLSHQPVMEATVACQLPQPSRR